MEELGLASSMTQQGPSQEEMVGQVIEALMSGVSPEDLLEQGVPAEVIQMAIEMIKQEQASGASVPAQEQGGLAASMLPVM